MIHTQTAGRAPGRSMSRTAITPAHGGLGSAASAVSDAWPAMRGGSSPVTRHHPTRRDHRDGQADLHPVSLRSTAWSSRPRLALPVLQREMAARCGEDLAKSDHRLLLGRETYDSFAGAWPDRRGGRGGETGFCARSSSRAAASSSPGATPTDQGRPRRGGRRARGQRGHRGHPRPRLVGVLMSGCSPPGWSTTPPVVHPVAGHAGPQAVRRRRRAVPPEGGGDGEAFPTGVIRVIYSPTEPPAPVGYDAVGNTRCPRGRSGLRRACVPGRPPRPLGAVLLAAVAIAVATIAVSWRWWGVRRRDVSVWQRLVVSGRRGGQGTTSAPASATAWRAPGSSKECVAPGTTWKSVPSAGVPVPAG